MNDICWSSFILLELHWCIFEYIFEKNQILSNIYFLLIWIGRRRKKILWEFFLVQLRFKAQLNSFIYSDFSFRSVCCCYRSHFCIIYRCRQYRATSISLCYIYCSRWGWWGEKAIGSSAQLYVRLTPGQK